MKIKIFFAALTSLLFTSCASRYLYSSTAHNIPMLAAKGDSKIAAAYSINSSFNDDEEDYGGKGFDVQGAYAFTDHFAMQAGYFSRSLKTFDSSSHNYFDVSRVNYKHRMFEAGIGYFTLVHKKQKFCFQVFGGVGFGKFSFTDVGTDNNLAYSRYHNTNVTKYYLAPSYSFRGRHLTTALEPRFTLLRYSKIKTNYTDPELEGLEIESIKTTSYVFFEPAVALSYRFKKLPGLLIEAQLGFSMRLPESSRPLLYSPVNFSAGLVFDMPKFIKGIANNNKD